MGPGVEVEIRIEIRSPGAYASLLTVSEQVLRTPSPRIVQVTDVSAPFLRSVKVHERPACGAVSTKK